jgi:PAS domain S-box-containing protein
LVTSLITRYEKTKNWDELRVGNVFSLTKDIRKALRLRGRLAEDSTARTLHNLVLALALWLVFSTFLVVLTTSVARPNLFLVPSLLITLATALILLRMGFFRAAGWLYLGGMLVYVTIIMVLTGGSLRNSPAVIFYASLPISAAWLFGYRATLWLAGLCITCALAFALLDIEGVKLHPYLPARPLAAWTFLVMAVLVAALPVAQVLRTLRDALAQSHRSEQNLSAELNIAQWLRRVAIQSTGGSGIEALYEEIIDATMAILHADFASLQVFHPERGTAGELRLLSHRGFDEQAVRRWKWVTHETRTTCGEALRTGGRVAVPDIRNCDFVAGTEDLQGYLDGGIHAAQSLPLVSRSGALLGMVSTYWRERHELSESELAALDILARLAADLIERSRAEEDLRKALEQLQFVTENMTCAVMRCSRDLRYLWANRSYAAWQGLTPEEIVGRPILDVVGHDAYKIILPQVEKVLSGETVEYQAQINYHAGARWIHGVGVPTKGRDQRIDGWIAILTDVTDARRSQEESFAKQKLESVGTLAGGIAHDFNNLLGSVLAQADLGLAEFSGGSSPEKELNAIREVAIRGSDIVRQLMIYAGKESEGFGPIDLSQIVEEMLALLKVSVSKHAVLEVDLAKNIPPVRANTAQLRQVVMNLITNASEALKDRDGVIRVTTRHLKATAELFGRIPEGLPAGDYLQLEVSDTGSGIPLDQQARVFDPFFTTKSAGHGLGLAVVQGIVRGLGGAINLVSEPGKGSTFRVVLPSAGVAAVIAPPGQIPTAQKPAGQLPERTILVVEDEDALRRAVVRMLRKTGHQVIETGDGSSAMEAIHSHKGPIDVLLLDITLPGTSSREVYEEARRLRPEMKTIATSAYGEDFAVKSFPGKIDHFIRKPYTIGDLMELMRPTSS